MDLIHKLEKARTKDDLEALGIEHLNIDVDKRKTKEVLRAELIGLAEERGWKTSGSGETPESDVTAPQPKPEAPAPAQRTTRMARNTKTGRIMQWTAAMAKMSHMEEI